MEMTATDPSVEYGVQHTQGQRAGGYVLRRIAEQPGMLQSTLEGLGLLNDPSAQTSKPSGRGTVGLQQALPSSFIESVVQATGLPLATFNESTVEQLRRVASFARSDGDAVSDNIRAAEYLIVSGRVSLFSR